MTIGLFPAMAHPRDITDSELLDRVLHAAAFVTTNELQHGMEWYPRANECLAYLSAELGMPLAGMSAAFSALSTNNDFSSNVRMFGRLLDGDANIHTRLIVDRATSALQHTYIYDALSAIDPNRTACKLRAFAWNIYDPAFPAVTLDRWMMRIFGPDYTSKTLGCRYGAERTIYQRIESAFVAAAEIHGMYPSSLQAAIWTMVRGSHD